MTAVAIEPLPKIMDWERAHTWRAGLHGRLVFTNGVFDLLHPGHVDVLLAPASAPWAHSHELVDFMHEVKAPVDIAIHYRIYRSAGAGISWPA